MSKATYSSIPTVDAVLMVKLIAPATLEEGYEFDAIFQGSQFKVTVPAGGIVEGQSFIVPFREEIMVNAFENFPQGVWKDGVFDCLKYGWLHPSFVLGLFCPLMLTGQVMTRMGLTYFAKPGSLQASSKTFKIVLSIAIGYFILRVIFQLIPHYESNNHENYYGSIPHHHKHHYQHHHDDDDDNHDNRHLSHNNYHPFNSLLTAIHSILGVAFTIFTVYVIAETRKAVRERYEIPKNRGEFEDLVCATFCGCCTASQLARQTANYDESQALFCSDDGLKASAIVVNV